MRNLRYFDEVVRSGSIRKASERLHIAASAVSRAIAQLEVDLDIELFERASRGMVLTPAGELYLNYVRRALLDEQRVRGELQGMRGLQTGHIRIASIEGLIADVVTDSIVSFRERYPRIDFDLSVGGSTFVTKAVRAREVDIGITAKSDQGLGVVVAERIEERLQAVLTPSHPAAMGEVSMRQLILSESIAIPDQNSAIRHQLDAFCRQEGIALKPALVTNSIDVLRSFARLGGGVTFLPRLAFRRDLAEGTLIGLSLRDTGVPVATVDICIPAGWRLSFAAITYLSFFQAELAALVEAQEIGDPPGNGLERCNT